MKMSKLKIVVILLVTNFCCGLSATIKGTLKLDDNQKSFELFIVSLLNENLGSTVDQDGNYAIYNVPIGKHVVKFYGLTYISQTDTVIIIDSNQTAVCNATIKVPWVESPGNIEKYHQTIDAKNAKRPVLAINLECYTFREGFITIHASIRNNSDISLRVLRIFECIDPIEAIVKDDKGTIVRQNSMRSDCVGEKLFPDKDDVIRIPERQTIDYSPVKLWMYDFRSLPEGKYSITLKYKFKKSDRLCCYGFEADYKTRYQSELNTLITVLRGEYVSSNSIVFENKH